MESAMNQIFQLEAKPTTQQGFCSSEIRNYLTAVNYVINDQSRLAVKDSRAMEAIGTAIARIKLEFHDILARNEDVGGAPISSPILSCSMTQSNSIMSIRSSHTNEETCCHLLLSEACSDLKSIVHLMNSAGYVAEFIDIYTSVRKSFLLMHLKRLGIRKLSNTAKRDLVQLDQFKTHVDNWIRASKMFYKILLPLEEKLSACIFDGISGFDFSSFSHGVKAEITNFAENLITSPRTVDKLFKLLDLYNALELNFPVLAFVIFADEHLVPATKQVICPQLLLMCFKLVTVVRETLLDFVKALVQEVSPPWGKASRERIYGLTWYVMNYIRRAVNYHNILSRIIISNPSLRDLKVPPDVKPEAAGQSPLACYMVLIIGFLIMKLKAKCETCKDDVVLVNLHMTNNLDYITQSIKASPKLEAMIGEEYMNNLRDNYLNQARIRYEKSTYKRMLQCLREPHWFSKFLFLRESTPTLKKRIKTFYILFEELRSAQAKWMESDLQLGEELRLLLKEKLVPSYKSFVERFNGISNHHHTENPYVEYSPSVFEMLICKEFF